MTKRFESRQSRLDLAKINAKTQPVRRKLSEPVGLEFIQGRSESSSYAFIFLVFTATAVRPVIQNIDNSTMAEVLPGPPVCGFGSVNELVVVVGVVAASGL